MSIPRSQGLPEGCTISKQVVEHKNDMNTVEINVCLDKLDKLNIEYGKTSKMEDVIDITNKINETVAKVNYSLEFFEMVLEQPFEMNELMSIETDITNINELKKRLEEDENKLDRYSIEKQCEEYVKLQLALKSIKEQMNGKSMFVKKIMD